MCARILKSSCTKQDNRINDTNREFDRLAVQCLFRWIPRSYRCKNISENNQNGHRKHNCGASSLDSRSLETELVREKWETDDLYSCGTALFTTPSST
jgi:hypothetical protein